MVPTVIAGLPSLYTRKALYYGPGEQGSYVSNPFSLPTTRSQKGEGGEGESAEEVVLETSR